MRGTPRGSLRTVPVFAAIGGLLAAAPLAAAGQAAGQTAGRDTAPPARSGLPEGVEVLGTFDHDWSVRTADGVEVPLEAYRGDVLVVNFWATWCAPCVAELGSFERLIGMLGEHAVGPSDEGGGDPDAARIRFLFVSPEDPEQVERFGRRYARGLELVTEARRAPPSLGELVLPTTLVVAPGGEIVLRHRGASEWAQPDVAHFLRAIARGPEEGSGPAPRILGTTAPDRVREPRDVRLRRRGSAARWRNRAERPVVRATRRSAGGPP